MNLGQLIDGLDGWAADLPVRFEGVRSGCPGPLISWRGIYAELALEHGYDPDNTSGPDDPPYKSRARPTVGALIEECHAAEGKRFKGYKGGNYKMDRSTRVWVDNYGEYNKIGLTALRYKDGVVWLDTADVSEYR